MPLADDAWGMFDGMRTANTVGRLERRVGDDWMLISLNPDLAALLECWTREWRILYSFLWLKLHFYHKQDLCWIEIFCSMIFWFTLFTIINVGFTINSRLLF